ncbi:hypothetical protein VP01_5788g1, partial [Puccinia sorghi]
HQPNSPTLQPQYQHRQLKSPPTIHQCHPIRILPKHPRHHKKPKQRKPPRTPLKTTTRRLHYSTSLFIKSPLAKGQTTLRKIDKSSFGWYPRTEMAHPKQKLATLCANPIQWYGLAHSPSTSTYATGQNTLHPGMIPFEDTENYPATGNTALDKQTTCLKKKKKKNYFSSDNYSMEVVLSPRRLPLKQIQGSKYDILKSSVEPLVGEI